jgi:hypothetical protein
LAGRDIWHFLAFSPIHLLNLQGKRYLAVSGENYSFVRTFKERYLAISRENYSFVRTFKERDIWQFPAFSPIQLQLMTEMSRAKFANSHKRKRLPDGDFEVFSASTPQF